MSRRLEITDKRSPGTVDGCDLCSELLTPNELHARVHSSDTNYPGIICTLCLHLLHTNFEENREPDPVPEPDPTLTELKKIRQGIETLVRQGAHR